MIQELPSLLEIVKKEKAELVIVDSYYVTDEYLKALMKLLPVVYFDDVFEFPYECTAIVNYNLFAYEWKQRYLEKYKDKKIQLFIGTKYVPLRKEFSVQVHSYIHVNVRNILVSTGGADPYKIAEKIAREVAKTEELSDVLFHFVVGSLSTNYKKMKELEASSENIIIHADVTNMADLMRKNDIAVAAAGSTLYELCVCGIPTVTYTFADNQLPGAETFAKQKIMINLGDYRRTTNFFPHMIEEIVELKKDIRRRVTMSQLMQELVDGKGANRLACEILKIVKEYKNVNF